MSAKVMRGGSCVFTGIVVLLLVVTGCFCARIRSQFAVVYDDLFSESVPDTLSRFFFAIPPVAYVLVPLLVAVVIVLLERKIRLKRINVLLNIGIVISLFLFLIVFAAGMLHPIFALVQTVELNEFKSDQEIPEAERSEVAAESSEITVP